MKCEEMLLENNTASPVGMNICQPASLREQFLLNVTLQFYLQENFLNTFLCSDSVS